jgi:adenine deaminase
LQALGVQYCIASVGKFAGTGVRNLPYQAANAAAFGLPIEDALKAISLYPAQILGVDDRVGSLEAGKDATLFVCSGDPLDVSVTFDLAFIQGRRVELNDRHKRLWRKYEKKYDAVIPLSADSFNDKPKATVESPGNSTFPLTPSASR